MHINWLIERGRGGEEGGGEGEGVTRRKVALRTD